MLLIFFIIIGITSIDISIASIVGGGGTGPYFTVNPGSLLAHGLVCPGRPRRLWMRSGVHTQSMALYLVRVG